MQRSARSSALYAPAMLFVVVAFAWPLARLVTVARGGVVRLFADAYNRRALIDSVAFSLVIAMVSVIASLVPALALARGTWRGRGVVRGLFAAPLALSGIVIGFLTVAMLGNAGVLPNLLHAEWLRGTAFTLGGLAAAYLYFEIPRATLALEPTLAALDARQFDAARTLGATPRQLVRYVAWPLCAPALRAALGVTFAAALGSFGVALIIATRFPLLPVELYRAFTGTMDDALAAAMALVLAVVALIGLVLTSRSAR